MPITRKVILLDWLDIKNERLKKFVERVCYDQFGQDVIIRLDSIVESAFNEAEDKDDYVWDDKKSLFHNAPSWIQEALKEEGLYEEELKYDIDKIFFHIRW